MICVSLRGVRGGVGTSSTLAALGYALHQLGQKVLVVDMCPENTLGLHFNLNLGHREGWARATLDQQPWHEQAWAIEPGLCVLPYGQLDAGESAQLDALLLQSPELWRQRQASLAEASDWILFDLPQRLPGHSANPHCEVVITVLNADAGCAHHVVYQGAQHATGDVVVALKIPGVIAQGHRAALGQIVGAGVFAGVVFAQAAGLGGIVVRQHAPGLGAAHGGLGVVQGDKAIE